MHISTGKGKYHVWLKQQRIGPDFLFILGGGEKTHIGGIVISEPNKPPTIIRLGTHYDHHVLTPIIETARQIYNTTIVAMGGIHIENASKEDINIITQNCKEITDQINTL